MELDIYDLKHLDAAEGRPGLGDWKEANEELERINPSIRAQPKVLIVK